jgi:hypothetical protein
MMACFVKKSRKQNVFTLNFAQPQSLLCRENGTHSLENTIFWQVILCSPGTLHRRFGEAQCLHLFSWRVSKRRLPWKYLSTGRCKLLYKLLLFAWLAYCLTLKMEAARSYETSVIFTGLSGVIFQLHFLVTAERTSNRTTPSDNCFKLVSFLASSSILNMEVTCSTETSVNFQLTAWCFTTQDKTLHNHRCENITSRFCVQFVNLQVRVNNSLNI